MKDFSDNVRLAKAGDTQAFANLYEMVYKDMYHTALYNLRNSHDACDAVSEAVIDAYASIGKLNNENAFRSWIMTILFAKIRKKQKEYVNSGEEFEENTSAENFDFENTYLRDAMNRLDDESKAILSLSVLGGYKSHEIARIYGIEASSVRSRISRIKEKLRIEMSV